MQINMGTKVLSLNNVLRVNHVSATQYKNVVWHGAELPVKPLLTFDEYINTIRSIADVCSTSDKQDVMFEMIDFAFRVNIVSSYASVELPKEINTLFNVIYSTDLYETVCRNVNQAQLESIKNIIWHLFF